MSRFETSREAVITQLLFILLFVVLSVWAISDYVQERGQCQEFILLLTDLLIVWILLAGK